MLLLNTSFGNAFSSNQLKLKNLRQVFLVVVLVLSGLAGRGQITLSGGSVATSVTTNTTTSFTLPITKPSGLAIGNIMIAQIVQTGNDGWNTIDDAVSSDGTWTEIAGSSIRSFNNNHCRATLLYKIATSADVVATSFSFALDANSNDGEGGIVAFAGVDNLNPFDVTPGNAYTNISNDQTLTATAITTVTANSVVVMFGALYNNFNISGWTTTTPGGLTELYDLPFNATNDMGMGAAFAVKAITGSTGVGSATIDGGNDIRNGAILIALKPAPTTPPSCATPVSPVNTSIIFPVNGNLTWNLVSGATGYRLYFGTDAAASNILNGTDLGNVTSYNPPSDLNFGTTYYWRIIPYNSFGSATGCQTWNFITETFTYCSASSIEPTVYESITNVTFAGINNSSLVAKTVGYSNYSSTVSPGVVYRGQDYAASVTEQFLLDQYGGYCKIFIDFNQNGTFDLPDEYVFGNPYSGNMSMTGTISIPVSATLGLTRMRVVLEGDADNTGALPCGIFQWGEVEDYSINIISPCSNPTDGGTIATAQTICSGGDPVAFTSTAPASGESGTLEYKWQSSTTGSGSGFSDVGAIGLTYNVPNGLAQTTWYKRLSKVTCSTVWAVEGESNVLEVTVNPIPTATLSGGGAICNGASTTLSVDFTGTGPWEITTQRNGAEPVTVTNISVNPYTFDVSAAGTYTISAFNDDLCDGTFSGSAVVAVNLLPTVTLSSNQAEVCFGDVVTALGYSATTGSPNLYSINFEQDALDEGFLNVANATLTGGTIEIVVPETVPPATYQAGITVTNSTTGCTSINYDITIIIHPLPDTSEIQTN